MGNQADTTGYHIDDLVPGFTACLQKLLPDGVDMIEDKRLDSLAVGYIYCPDSKDMAECQSRRYGLKRLSEAIPGLKGSGCSGRLSDVLYDGKKLVLPLRSPVLDDIIYLVAAPVEDIESSVRKLEESAESLEKAMMERAFINLAVNDTGFFLYLLGAFDSDVHEKVNEEYIDSLYDLSASPDTFSKILETGRKALSFMSPFASMSRGTGSFDMALPDYEFHSYNEEIDKRKGFGKSLARYKKTGDKQALGELKTLMKDVDWNDIIKFLSTLPPSCQKRLYDGYVDRVSLGSRSSVKIEVWRFNSTDPKSPNDGIFRIYLVKDGYEPRLLHFRTKIHNVLYFMYLLDRKHRGNDVMEIDFLKNRDAFVRIGEKVYSDIKSAKDFDSDFMYLAMDKDSAVTKLYTGVNTVLKKALGELSEPYTPFRILRSSHITAKAENIFFPDDFKDIRIV